MNELLLPWESMDEIVGTKQLVSARRYLCHRLQIAARIWRRSDNGMYNHYGATTKIFTCIKDAQDDYDELLRSRRYILIPEGQVERYREKLMLLL